MSWFAQNEKARGMAWCAAVFLAFAALYLLMAQRGFSWQDSGEFQYRMFAGDFHWCSGIARAHPLYIALGMGWMALFPAAWKAYAITTVSSLAMAAALAFLAAAVLRMTKSWLAAVTAAATLGLAHMAWWMAEMAEVYALSLAFCMAELYVLARASEKRETRWIALLFLLNGLHASVHNFAFLELPVFAVFLPGRGAVKRIALCAMAWMAGAAALEWLFVEELVRSGSLTGTVKSLLFGLEFEKPVLGTGGFRLKLAVANYALAAVSFVSPCWLFALKGIGAWRKERVPDFFKRCLLALTLIHFIFWVRYFVGDQATFILPTLGTLAAWVGFGTAALEKEGRRRLVLMGLAFGILFACGVPAVLSSALRVHDFGIRRARELPGRSEFAYWLLPWKAREDSAARFVRQVAKMLRPGDVLLADNTSAAPLLAARAAGAMSKEWRLVTYVTKEKSAEVKELLDTKPRVFIVSPVREYEVSPVVLDGNYRFEKDGILYRVRRKAK
jgi:hypothetical protein